jgi:hypothetical protein
MAYVYIGYDKNGLFKIGKANDYRKRAKQIQNMNPAFEIMTYIETDNPNKTERELHDKFFGVRIVGEWFRLTAEDIQAIIYEYNGIDVPIEEVEKDFDFYTGQNII